eukprot:286191-Rhodomonas_salina.2
MKPTVKTAIVRKPMMIPASPTRRHRQCPPHACVLVRSVGSLSPSTPSTNPRLSVLGTASSTNTRESTTSSRATASTSREQQRNTSGGMTVGEALSCRRLVLGVGLGDQRRRRHRAPVPPNPDDLPPRFCHSSSQSCQSRKRQAQAYLG